MVAVQLRAHLDDEGLPGVPANADEVGPWGLKGATHGLGQREQLAAACDPLAEFVGLHRAIAVAVGVALADVAWARAPRLAVAVQGESAAAATHGRLQHTMH